VPEPLPVQLLALEPMQPPAVSVVVPQPRACHQQAPQRVSPAPVPKREATTVLTPSAVLRLSKPRPVASDSLKSFQQRVLYIYMAGYYRGDNQELVTAVTLVCDQRHDVSISVPKRNSLAPPHRLKRKLRAIPQRLKLVIRSQSTSLEIVRTAVPPLGSVQHATASLSTAAIIDDLPQKAIIVRRLTGAGLSNTAHF
jgi:hypothetical protein